MALKGTLKDFGIADIFQLISHQSKTGVLQLQTKGQEVRVYFFNGDVVRAGSTTRKQKDLLGSMMVRAEMLTQEQLDQALDVQRRTLKRLGDILIEQGLATSDNLRTFAHLQTTETVYRLFTWESGTYEFAPEEVEFDADHVEPIRSENVLMEGFRMVDEWPMIRKKISSYEMTFVKLKEMETADEGSVEEDLDDAFDDMFAGDDKKKKKKKKNKNIGQNETLVFGFLAEDRNVERLIDLSCLGEFETCKALLNLLNEGFVKAVSTKAGGKKKEVPGSRVRRFPIGRVFIQVGMMVLIVGVVLMLYRVFEVDLMSMVHENSTRHLTNPAARELIDRNQERRVLGALDVYRLENGRYPEKLSELVDAELLVDSDLRYPWRDPRAYRRTDEGVIVLRPFE